MSVSLAAEPIHIVKADFLDPASRIFKLLDRMEPKLRTAFLEAIEGLRGSIDWKEVESLLGQGRFAEAMHKIEINSVRLMRFTNQVNTAFQVSAQETAAVISGVVTVDFDLTNLRAVDIMRRNRLEFVREFLDEQRRATHFALNEGVQRGVNPRVMAREFRQSIGLTQRQERAVANFRRLLSEDPRDALTRRLRDGRFDRTVLRSIRTGRPLSQTQIDKMVTRYRERFVKFRAEKIARTEALTSVHEGSEEMYQQAIDEGKLDASTLIKTWMHSQDKRVRDSHSTMHFQTRRHGELFITGAGNRIRHPGDRNAPAREIIECRCAMSTRIREVRSA